MDIPARDQPQKPLYTTHAHVFQIDPDTKKSWLPSCKQAVAVSFFYDSSKFIYKVISVDNSKILINSTITSAMTFTKTSQKFGQWSDAKNNTVYGLGFSSESDLKKFAEKFKEMKTNVRCGTPPSIPKNPANLKINNNHMTDPSPATSMKSMSSNSTSSYDDETQSPGSHRSSSSSSENQIKYENDRLKKALAQSSANAKKWESEFQTLKNNNARLTAALQESAINVEKWKEQLNNYKEDNQRLRKKLSNSTAGSAASATDISDLEQRVSDLESKLKRKDEELKKVTQHSTDELHLLREKNSQLTKKTKHYEEKLSDDANNNRKQNDEVRTYETKMKQLNETSSDVDSKLRELFALQQKMKSLMDS